MVKTVNGYEQKVLKKLSIITYVFLYEINIFVLFLQIEIKFSINRKQLQLKTIN